MKNIGVVCRERTVHDDIAKGLSYLLAESNIPSNATLKTSSSSAHDDGVNVSKPSLHQSQFTSSSVTVYLFLRHCLSLPPSQFISSVTVYIFLSHCLSLPPSQYISSSVTVYLFLSHCLSLPPSQYISSSVTVYLFLSHSLSLPPSQFISFPA